MTVRVSVLNSSQPNAGTKPYDSELDIVRTHFSCAGRLPHPQHVYGSGVAEVQGNDILVRQSAWLVDVTRPGAPPSYESFKVLFQVTADELVPTGGLEGVVIARVFASAVNVGAVGSVSGTQEGQLQFISGQNLSDADIDASLAGDFWVRVATYQTGVAAGTDLALTSSITASSSAPGYPVTNLNDVSFATYWLNDPAEPIATDAATITFDFATTQVVDTWELAWYFPGFESNNFQIESSLDGTTWTPQGAPITQGHGATGVISGAFASPVTAQYVRFLFAAGSGASATYLAIANISLFAANSTGLTQGDMAIIQASTGLKMEGSDIDMGNGFISNLQNAVEPHQAVNLGQLQSIVTSTGGGGFLLVGNRTGLSGSRTLTWDDVLFGAGQYEVQRRIGSGVWQTIVTLIGAATSYTDADIITGTVRYRIRAVDPAINYNLTSNQITFTGTTAGVYACGDYGSGADGAYTGGSLQAGRVYEFTSFTLANAAMSITGEGETIIMVQGDLTINTGEIILPYTNTNLITDVTVCGQTRSVGLAALPQAFGGIGGQGGQPPIAGNSVGNTGGTGGQSSLVRGGAGNNGYISPSGGGFIPGIGGAGGSFLSPNGQDGTDGETQVVAVGSLGAGGGGGAGGDGISRGSVIFVVGGNVTIDTSSILTGQGGNGGNGGRGGIGGDNTIGVGAPGGGGGGAGGNGGDGGKVKIFHPVSSAVSANPILQLSAGLGGLGGLDGRGGIASSIGFPTIQAPSGFAGNPGNPGVQGSLELIAV